MPVRSDLLLVVGLQDSNIKGTVSIGKPSSERTTIGMRTSYGVNMKRGIMPLTQKQETNIKGEDDD